MEEKADNDLSPGDIEEMEERRQNRLKKAGIDEGDIIEEARKGIGEFEAFFTENVQRYKADTTFLLRDQWSANERADTTRLKKVCLTYNKIYDINKKVIGEFRKNKPALMVRSLTGRATQAEIDLRTDMIRTICYKSQHDLVLQQAFQSALNGGFGAFEVNYDYSTPMSFYQEVMFRPIIDPLMTAYDPAALMPHKGDGDFCSRLHILSDDRFKAMFPYITDPVSYRETNFVNNLRWQAENQVVVADYYKKNWYPVKIYQLSNDMVVTEDEWKEMQKNFAEIKLMANGSLVVGNMILDEIPHVVMERMTSVYDLMHYRMTNNKIIDFMDFPSKHLPIIFVDGDSGYIEGQQLTRSFTHNAKDAQRSYNYIASEIITEIKNRRREQWIVTKDNIAGYEQMWKNPEVQIGALVAKPDPKTGMMPTKQPAWDLSPTLLQQLQKANQDIREILGFSEVEQLQGKDISGKARRERKTEGSMSAYVYFDNLSQAIEQAGRVILDLLPVIYGEKNRPMVISRQDNSTENIKLNNEKQSGIIENALTKGDYDVEIDSAPSFAVQKEIALEFLQETVAANPQMFPMIADIWAKQLDVQFQKQLVDRMRNFVVPPEVIAKEEGKQMPPPKPSPEEQMMQMEMQERQQQIQERAYELQLREQKQKENLEIDREKHELEKAKLLIDTQRMLADIEMNKANHSAEQRKMDLEAEIQLTKIMADIKKSQQTK